MSSFTSSHEMGNVPAAKGNESRVVAEVGPHSEGGSDSDHGDKDQLARLGKKQVLRVSQNT